MMNTMPTLFLSLTLFILSGFLTGKSFASMDLKSLIVEGLQHNINIKNQRISLEKAKIDLGVYILIGYLGISGCGGLFLYYFVQIKLRREY